MIFIILNLIIDFLKGYNDKFIINNPSIKYSFLFGFILNKLDIDAKPKGWNCSN